MSGSSTNLSFSELEFRELTESMTQFVTDVGLRCALLVDRSGQLITAVGEAPDFDATSFASLAAADFSANDQLARLLGEKEFAMLLHQGERESMYIADVAGRFILVALFDKRITLGLARLRVAREVQELTRMCETMFTTGDGGRNRGPGLLAGAEDEIDQLFR